MNEMYRESGNGKDYEELRAGGTLLGAVWNRELFDPACFLVFFNAKYMPQPSQLNGVPAKKWWKTR